MICTSSAGPGFVKDGVCVLDYENTESVVWNNAVTTCIGRGGDLCSTAQYYTITTEEPDLFYSNHAVWTEDFSDNDGGSKSFAINSSDNPSISQTYGFACCSTLTPEPYRSNFEMINGVAVTYLHSEEDTTFRAAARICHSRGSDLCSKSEYVAINDAGRFSANFRRVTKEMCDNDSDRFDSVCGTNVADNPSWANDWAFACCGSIKPVDNSCPGTQLANGLCVIDIHDTEDANFFDAARACTGLEADVCSNSEMQALRNAGMFFGRSWTNSGADNDGGSVGGLAGSEPNDPDPATTLQGYACCL